MLGVGGTFIFKFQVNDITNGQLPTLKFVYTRNLNRVNVGDNTTAILHLKKDETVPQNNAVTPNDNVVSFPQEGGSKELNVENNTTFSVQLRGNPTTGYVWYLDNAEEITKSDVIEELTRGGNYIQDNAVPGLIGVGGSYVFKFQVKNVNKGSLPALKFVYKRSWVNVPIATATVILNTVPVSSAAVDEPEEEALKNIITFGNAGGHEELSVVSNSSFTVKLDGNPTTGYSWYLDNADEIKNAAAIEATNLDEYNSGKYAQRQSKKLVVGAGGTFTFEFKTHEIQGELPQLKFVYKRPWETNDPIYEAVVTLVAIKTEIVTEEIVFETPTGEVTEFLLVERPTEEPVDEPTESGEDTIFFSDEGGDEELTVVSNSSFTIMLEGNPTTGYSWYLDNADEIKNAAAIEATNLDEYNSGEYAQNPTDEILDGVGGVFTFKFKTYEIQGELPQLKFVYKRPWETNDPAFKAIVTLVTPDVEVPSEEPTAEEEAEADEPTEYEVEPTEEPTDDEDEAEAEEGTEVVMEEELADDDEDTIYFARDGGNEELDVSSNTPFTIKLEGNPSTGYSWYLNNADELKDSAIEPLNLDEYNSGDFLQDDVPYGVVGARGTFVFKFKVKEIDGELPPLEFVYKRPWEQKDPLYEAKVTLVTPDREEPTEDEAETEAEEPTEVLNEEPVEEPTEVPTEVQNEEPVEEPTEVPTEVQNEEPVEEPTEAPVEKPIETDNVINISNQGGNQVLAVENNTLFTVKLKGNPTTGYSWYLDNVDEIANSKSIDALNVKETGYGEYAQDKAPLGWVGVGGTFIFKFKVNEIQDQLPQLKFVYKRIWETTPPIYQSTITLESEVAAPVAAEQDEEDVVFDSDFNKIISFNENGGVKKLTVQGNSTVIVELEGNQTTGYSWVLENAEEIEQSDAIEALGLNESNGTNDYILNHNEGNLDGVGGTYRFKFNIKSFCPKNLPKLKFTYQRPWEIGQASSVAVVTLVADQDSCEGVEQNAVAVEPEVKEINLDQNATKGEIKVKNNDTFAIKVKGNVTTGYSWYLLNEKELVKAGITPLNLNRSKSGDYLESNPRRLLGASGTFVFKFKVGTVTKDLPTIKLIYRRSWIPIGSNDARLEVTVKPE